MKKVLSIISAVLILISGMHFTMSMHFCHENLAAVTLTAGSNGATCGMVRSSSSTQSASSGITILENDCCHNSNVLYSVDEYSPSTQLNLQEVTPLHSFLFILPVEEPVQKTSKISIYRHLIFPEKDLMAGSVPIEGLCSYRI